MEFKRNSVQLPTYKPPARGLVCFGCLTAFPNIGGPMRGQPNALHDRQMTARLGSIRTLLHRWRRQPKPCQCVSCIQKGLPTQYIWRCVAGCGTLDVPADTDWRWWVFIPASPGPENSVSENGRLELTFGNQAGCRGYVLPFLVNSILSRRQGKL